MASLTKRALVALGALVAIAAPVTAAGSPRQLSEGAPVYVTVGADGNVSLTRVDPRTLEPTGSSLPLAPNEGAAGAGAVSPNGSTLALTRWGDSVTLSFVSLPAMRRLGSVTISNARGYFSSVWIDDNRLVAVIGHPDGLQAVLIDVTQQRVLETTKLPDAHAIAVAGAPGGVAILLSRHGIGPMRVAVISGRHHWIRTVRRIQGGSAPTATPVQTQQIHPALVVDRSTSRAFVVGAGPEPLAQIDLRTGALTYKRLSEELGRPSFRSDYVERFAIAASAGKLVVSGWDDWTASNDGTGWRPVGAAMIDTLSGAVKVIDARAVSAWNTGSAIVTDDLSGSFEVFSPSGRLQFPLLQPPRNSGNIPRACTNGRYLYVAEEASGGLLIFDLTNGALLGGMPLEAFINVVLSSGDVGNAAVNPWQC